MFDNYIIYRPNLINCILHFSLSSATNAVKFSFRIIFWQNTLFLIYILFFCSCIMQILILMILMITMLMMTMEQRWRWAGYSWRRLLQQCRHHRRLQCRHWYMCSMIFRHRRQSDENDAGETILMSWGEMVSDTRWRL